jgi:mitogen-activated protein kinase organizer 1
VSYRCRGCFGFNEEYVVIGDEDGHIWAWNVVDAKPLPRSHEKAHEKPITWTEYRPFQEDSQDKANEMITASADGLVKVWRDATP